MSQSTIEYQNVAKAKLFTVKVLCGVKKCMCSRHFTTPNFLWCQYILTGIFESSNDYRSVMKFKIGVLHFLS